MPLIEWQDDFKIGIPSIDHEHQELIELLNTLHAGLSRDASAEEISRFLHEVDAQIGAHFALEEWTMRELNYDQYRDHKADHDKLLEQIRDIAEAYEAGVYTNYGGRLAHHLRQWFSEHFRTKDARLHRFTAAQDS
jgi:hemerythrin